MPNPRYPQPQQEQPSGRERKLSELGALLQMSNASQAPQLEQQQLQQRQQQGQQATMLQFMQLMQQQQEAQQRARQSAGTLDLGNRELQQRQGESDRRGKDAIATLLAGLVERGDTNAQDAFGSYVPEYGQSHNAAKAAMEAKRAAAMPDALMHKVGLQQSAISPDFWANILSMGNYNTAKQVPSMIKSGLDWINKPAEGQQTSAPGTTPQSQVSYNQNYDERGNPTNLIPINNEAPLKPALNWLLQQLAKTGQGAAQY